MSEAEIFEQLIAPPSKGGEGLTVLGAQYRLWYMRSQEQGQELQAIKNPLR